MSLSSSNSFSIIAGSAADGRGDLFSPVFIRIDRGSILEIREALRSDTADLVKPDLLITPPLVNSHVHLDLSDGIPQKGKMNFVDFIYSVISHRKLQAENKEQLDHVIKKGIQSCLRGGVALVGNISTVNTILTDRLLEESLLGGINFKELISSTSTGFRLSDRRNNLQNGFFQGWAPHAPYTVSLNDFKKLKTFPQPISIHLAETLEEINALKNSSGPLSQLLKKLTGQKMLWQSNFPIKDVIKNLINSNSLLVHLNHLDEDLDELIIKSNLKPVFCPRASFYLNQLNDNGHPCLRLINKGVNVSLGSDSSLVLEDPSSLSTIYDARFLYKKYSLSSSHLFEMCSASGARALGFDPDLFYLKEGPVSGLLGWQTDFTSLNTPLDQLMIGSHSPEWLIGPTLGTL